MGIPAIHRCRRATADEYVLLDALPPSRAAGVLPPADRLGGRARRRRRARARPLPAAGVRALLRAHPRRPARRRRPHRAYTRLLERVLDGYRAVADGARLPACAGDRRGGHRDRGRRRRGHGGGRGRRRRTSWSSRAATSPAASLAVELDLNVDAANHLGAPVLLVVARAQADGRAGARRRSRQGITTLRERGCTLIGVVANRVDPAPDRRRAGRVARGGRRDLVAAAAARRRRCSPRRPSPRSRGRSDARYLQPVDGAGRWTAGRTREVGRLIVGAMGLEHFLERIARGRPGDHPGRPRRHRRRQPRRAPVGHLPARWPGWCSPAAWSRPRCAGSSTGYGDAGIPVIAVGRRHLHGHVRGHRRCAARSPRAARARSRRRSACSRTASTPPRCVERIDAGPARPGRPR